MIQQLRENKYFYLGFGGWIILALFSILEYGKIASTSCYFLLSWPFCSQNIGLEKHFLQGLILLSAFSLLALSGKFIFDRFKTNQITDKKYLAAIFIICAFLVLPFGSGDMLYYFHAGKALDNQINPYTGSWEISNLFLSPASNMTTGAMYGPIALFMFELFYKLGLHNIFLFMIFWKLSMIFFLVLAGILVFKLIKTYSPDANKKTFYLFWLTQPLMLFEWISSGHFDAVWLVFVLLAFLFANKKQWWLVLICLTIGTWIKFIPVLTAPWFVLWWWQDLDKDNYLKKSLEIIFGLSLSVLLTYFSWLTFWQGPKVFQPIILQSKWAVSSIFSVVYYSLKPASDFFLAGQSHWFLTRLVHLILLISALYLFFPLLKKIFSIILKKKIMDGQEYIQAIFVSLLVYLLIWQKSFWPWYVVWLIPLGLIVYSYKKNIFLEKILLWLSLSPLFFYLVQQLASADMAHLWFFYYVVLTIIAYPLWQLYKWRNNNYELN